MPTTPISYEIKHCGDHYHVGDFEVRPHSSRWVIIHKRTRVRIMKARNKTLALYAAQELMQLSDRWDHVLGYGMWLREFSTRQLLALKCLIDDCK